MSNMDDDFVFVNQPTSKKSSKVKKKRRRSRKNSDQSFAKECDGLTSCTSCRIGLLEALGRVVIHHPGATDYLSSNPKRIFKAVLEDVDFQTWFEKNRLRLIDADKEKIKAVQAPQTTTTTTTTTTTSTGTTSTGAASSSAAASQVVKDNRPMHKFTMTKEELEIVEQLFMLTAGKYDKGVIECVIRHHPQARNMNVVLNLLMEGINPNEWFEKDRLLLRTSYEAVKKDCEICYDELKVTEMFTLDCKEAHRFCFDCIRHHVQLQINQGAVPVCPDMNCDHTLSQLEVKQVCGEGELYEKYKKVQLRQGLASLGNLVGCPTPECQNFITLDDLHAKVRIECGSCGKIFCSLCKENYHYNTGCQEAKQLEMQWVEWRVNASSKYRQNQDKAVRRQMKAEKKALEKRRKEIEADERYKAEHIRHCPKCDRQIERTAGCDSMICGRNYHGGNVQDGCGTSFNWQSAKKYQPKIGSAASHLQNLDLKKLAEASVKSADHGEYNKCDLCGGRIKGLRFGCINCPGDYSLCEQCQTLNAHQKDHIFHVIFAPPTDD